MIELYLSDLDNGMRLSVEKAIREKRPDLVEHMEMGDTIIIGEVEEELFKLA